MTKQDFGFGSGFLIRVGIVISCSIVFVVDPQLENTAMTFSRNKHVIVLTVVELNILNFVSTKFKKHNLTLHFSCGEKIGVTPKYIRAFLWLPKISDTFNITPNFSPVQENKS